MHGCGLAGARDVRAFELSRGRLRECFVNFGPRRVLVGNEENGREKGEEKEREKRNERFSARFAERGQKCRAAVMRGEKPRRSCAMVILPNILKSFDVS